VCLLLGAGGVAALVLHTPPQPPPQPPPTAVTTRTTGDQAIRDQIYADLQPVRLAGCTLERIGEKNDGGYVMCGNLLESEVGYSYGISNYDGWGCGISTQLAIAVHQYDCFDQRAPVCDSGRTQFHPECIAATPSVDAKGRRFDSLANQLARNGDAARRLVVKMDVEGAEWKSLLETPPEVLSRIDQLAIELHANAADVWTQHLLIAKLKEQFHVAHLHFNNFGCMSQHRPMPSYAWEVLFVNKRLASPSADTTPVARPGPLDAPNNPTAPDCQYDAGS
jgi:hypothetical protein